eukprot:Awhi_evm1s12544
MDAPMTDKLVKRSSSYNPAAFTPSATTTTSTLAFKQCNKKKLNPLLSISCDHITIKNSVGDLHSIKIEADLTSKSYNENRKDIAPTSDK